VVEATRRGFGIDIGGSGIKGALVDLDAGKLIGDRIRIETPKPSTPSAVADVVHDVVTQAGWDGPVGVTLPAVVKKGVAHTAANIDKQWIGTDADALFAKRLGRGVDQIAMLNDADAAGMAEIRFGDPVARKGVTALLTFGTGIGSAVFQDGKLVPNTEFGHLEIDGHDAEKRAAASVKDNRAGEPHLARPVHRRRRRQQEGREMGAAAGHPDSGAGREPAEQRRDRRCRGRRGGGHPALIGPRG
jgi:polyphosphate glucokinase